MTDTPEAEVSQEPGTIDALRERLQGLVAGLQRAQAEDVPQDEPYYASASALKGGVKRGVVRATRPATRRYDRLATELAEVAVELSEQLEATTERLARTDAGVERLRGDIERLDLALSTIRRAPEGDGRGETVPDDYYWAFERRMRGSAASIVKRLRQYERFAVQLRERLAVEEPPLWLDLGCGRGEFAELVGEWGWRVQGVDASPGAIEACRERKIDATLGDALEFLRTRRGEPPAAISAIQLIEHLPRSDWIGVFEAAHRALAPGGALLMETINALNPVAVMSFFVADVTHTWPGHPQTLTLMARHAGFAEVEVIYLNPDERGNAQDFAIWARDEGGGSSRSRASSSGQSSPT